MVVNIIAFINDYFNFYDKDVELEYNNLDNDIIKALEKFCNKKIDKYYINAWEVILSSECNKYINSYVIDFLLENEICLDCLCDCNLADTFLLQIYEKSGCIEPLIRLGKRLLINDSSVNEFVHFILSYRIPLIYESLFKYLLIIYINHKQNDIIYEKFKELIKLAKEVINNNDLIELVNNYDMFISIIYEKNANILYEYYDENKIINLLALSLNPLTPTNVLKKMLKVKDQKYSKIIRNNARMLLEK
ncbi:MAG: hypothetical protein RBR27_05760 [Bacilli bacterium]|jgi:hypothetical protein|nr:hypothetical protein [Bacilli bacterium]